MKRRVRCADTRCNKHRDLTTTPICGCGEVGYTVVLPTAGDIEAARQRITHELIECAELLDEAIYVNQDVITAEHPIAVRIASACRERAFVTAGILAWSRG